MEDKLATCTYCGKRFIYSKDDKYWPCCSKECFYKRMGVFKKKKQEKEIQKSECNHEKYCKTCGKKVSVLYNGSYCSKNCESLFEEEYKKHIKNLSYSNEKKPFFIYCNLCGKSFEPKSKRNRFCTKCSHDKKNINCSCFHPKPLPVPVHSGNDLQDMIAMGRDRSKSYAELQIEETLKLMRKGEI